MDRIAPDRAALEFAHRWLCTPSPLDEMLKTPALKVVLETLARRHMVRRAQPDVKRLQANDKDWK